MTDPAHGAALYASGRNRQPLSSAGAPPGQEPAAPTSRRPNPDQVVGAPLKARKAMKGPVSAAGIGSERRKPCTSEQPWEMTAWS